MEMCAASTEVTELRRTLAATVERLDLGMVLPSDAVRLVTEGALIERLGLAVKTLASARVAESGAWRGQGDPSAVEWLARTTGTTTRCRSSSRKLMRRRLGRKDDTPVAS